MTETVEQLGNSGSRRRWPMRALGDSRGMLLTGVVLIVAQVVWRGLVIARSFFREDDFVMIVRATEQNLDWGYLLTPHAGRLMPGGLGLGWILARVDTYNWAAVTGVILTIQALASLAVLRMLVVLFGRRPATLLPFAFYLVAPLTLPALTWWSAALYTIVPQIAVAMAVTSHVLYQQDGRRGHAVAALLWILAGMLFSLGVALLPLLLLVLTAVYFTEGRGVAAVRLALRAAPGQWAAYGSAMFVSGCVYLVTRLSFSAGIPGPATILAFLWRLIGQTFVTGIVGGPVRWYFTRPDHGIAWPHPGVVTAAWIVVTLIVIITIRLRRHAGVAWLVMLGYVVLAAALPAFLSTAASVGEILGAESELLAGTAPVVALCLGLTILPLRGEAEPYLRTLRMGRILLGIAGAGVVVLAVWSSTAYASGLRTQSVRDYLATASAELARTPSSVQIYDTTVSRRLMSAWFGDYRSTARILSPLAEPDLRDAMRHPGPTGDPMVFDESGHLRPMGVLAVVVAASTAKPACYPLLGDKVDIPLAHDLPRKKYTVAFSYTSTRDALAVFSYGGERVPITLDRGTHVLYLQVTAGGPALRIDDVSSHTGLCVSVVRIGAPTLRSP